MPTTVIQVLGSLTFKTIDSVLKVDHVSEESPLSSLTLIKQISLLTNTINPPSIHLLQPASADNTYLDLDYSGYHKNLIQ